MKKATAMICAAAFFAALLCGCRSSNELKAMALVMGVAIDKGGGENEYTVTAQIAQPPSTAAVTGGESGGPADNEVYTNLTKTGAGVSDAMREISRLQSRKLYTGHIQVVIISRAVAADGIEPVLNYFIGSADGRMSTLLLISEGEAKMLLEAKTGTAQCPAESLAELIGARVKAGELPEPTMLSFINDMLGGLTAPVIPIIEIKKNGESELAEVTGTAAFSGAELSDVMTRRQSQAVFDIRGKTDGGYLTARKNDGYMTLHVEKASSHFSAGFSNETPEITVVVRREYSVDDSSPGLDLLNDGVRQRAELYIKKQLARQFCDTIEHAKEKQLDVFGFSEYLYRFHSGKIKPIYDNREIFPELEVKLELEVRILGTGALQKRLRPEKQGRV